MSGRETKLLMKSYMQTKKPVGFFQSLFTNVKTFNQTSVDCDIELTTRYMADFNVRGATAKDVTKSGYKTYTYTPPILNESHSISYAECSTAIPGEDIYSPRAPQERANYHRLDALMKLEDRFVRREEYMAKQALFSREIDIANGDTISFPGSDSLLDISPTADWDAASGVKIIDDVHDTCELVFKTSGEVPDTMVLGSDALGYFNADSNIQTLLETRRRFAGQMQTTQIMKGVWDLGYVEFNGYILRLLAYNDWYDVSGTPTAFMPAKKVLVYSSSGRRDRLYGGIEANGAVNAVARYADTWEEKNPDGWMVRLQSAPLLIPTALNTWATIEVAS